MDSIGKAVTALFALMAVLFLLGMASFMVIVIWQQVFRIL